MDWVDRCAIGFAFATAFIWAVYAALQVFIIYHYVYH